MTPLGPAAALAAVLVLGAPPPDVLCTVTDRRLAELSGLVTDAAGVWAVSDDGRRVDVHRLDPATCAVVDTRTALVDPRDTEDLALGPDGAMWVGDIGDNERRRDTVAVIVLPPSGAARPHRLAYPDGPHDAEALLVDAAGAPVVVTKEPAGPAGIYRTDGPPGDEGPTPLVRVGELVLPASDTVGGPDGGGLGSRVVTGAAVSADRRMVALRSYTDAWLYPAPDGDVVAALAGSPVRVPLPGEPQGEAIAFLPDGTLLSGSEARGGAAGELRAVPRAADLAGRPPTPVRASGPEGSEGPEWLPAAAGAGAVAAALLLVTLLLVRRRRYH